MKYTPCKCGNKIYIGDIIKQAKKEVFDDIEGIRCLYKEMITVNENLFEQLKNATFQLLINQKNAQTEVFQ